MRVSLKLKQRRHILGTLDSNLEKFIFRFSMTVSILLLLIVLALVSFQTYIRWFVNQNFTLVGGNELEVLTASVFVLIIAITYIHRPGRITE